MQVEAQLIEELQKQGLLATPEQPHPRPLRYEDANRLPYLSMVVREAQRLYPVCPSRPPIVPSLHSVLSSPAPCCATRVSASMSEKGSGIGKFIPLHKNLCTLIIDEKVWEFGQSGGQHRAGINRTKTAPVLSAP